MVQPGDPCFTTLGPWLCVFSFSTDLRISILTMLPAIISCKISAVLYIYVNNLILLEMLNVQNCTTCLISSGRRTAVQLVTILRQMRIQSQIAAKMKAQRRTIVVSSKGIKTAVKSVSSAGPQSKKELYHSSFLMGKTGWFCNRAGLLSA